MEKRPSMRDKAVVAAAVKDILGDVIQWTKDNGDDEAEQSSIESQLIDAAEYEHDGFGIAYRLKNDHGWECDSGLVEILEGFSWNLIEARDRHIAQWVKRNSVAVDYAVGDRVKFKYPDQKKHTEGEVTKIDVAHAVVHVFCESLGHVRDGVGTHARLVNAEMVERVEASEA